MDGLMVVISSQTIVWIKGKEILLNNIKSFVKEDYRIKEMGVECQEIVRRSERGRERIMWMWIEREREMAVAVNQL